MVGCAPGAHRGLLQRAQAGCGLACVEDLGARALHLPHGPGRRGRDARESLEEVERRALSAQQRPRAAFQAKHEAALAPFPFRGEPLDLDVRIQLAKRLLGRVEPEEDAGRLLGDGRPGAGALGDRRHARGVPVAEVLGERARDDLPQPISRRTVIVRNAGSLAPCRRAPALASARRYSTTSAVIRSPGSSAGIPGG